MSSLCLVLDPLIDPLGSCCMVGISGLLTITNGKLALTAASNTCAHKLSLCLQLTDLCTQAAGKEDAIRTALIEYDRDGSGRLSGEDFEMALRAAGLKFTRHQAISLKRRLDKDRSNTVPVHELLSLLGISDEQPSGGQ